jgi:hypothetical protein
MREQNKTPETAGGTRLWKPGESGNPNGRPKGARNKTTLALEELLDGEAETITRKAIELAKGGDLGAIRLCLDRLLPARRDRHVCFEVPKIETASDAMAFAGELVTKVAAVELTPSEAADLGKLIDNYVRAIEVCDLEQRLAAIERQQQRKAA